MLHVWHWSQLHVTQAVGFLWKIVHRRPQYLHYSAGSRCLKGPYRATNEDRCYADQRRGLFVVADGMGGHAGGEQASQTVVEVMSSQLSPLIDCGVVSRDEFVEGMVNAVLCANEELINMAQVDVSLKGMGAALVVGVVRQNQLFVCSVGDSRAYRLRRNEFEQLTLDDTLVQGLVSAGAITAGEAARHPMRHVLLHSVGTRKLEKDMRVEVHRLQAGDRLLFTSDGLTDAVEQSDISAVNAQYADPCAAATALVDFAQRAGARDNMTCIVVDLY